MSAQAKLTIGSRGSLLALWQSRHIKALLEQANPGLEVEIVIIKTQGDIIQDVALSKIGDKGLFTKELEVALAKGEIDLCVHSMKDVPTLLPEGLVLGPVPKRASAYDVLVAPKGVGGLDDLPKGARIGTGSLRRRAQLYALDKGFELLQLRGNLDTRIKKVEEGVLDAVILAAAGIHRLGWEDRIAAIIPAEVMTPAVGQGALALELREGDLRTAKCCASLADEATALCVSAERFVMRALDGGCQVPIGAYARLEEGLFTLQAMVAKTDGSVVLRAFAQGSADQASVLAQAVVDDLCAQGAPALLEGARALAGEDGSLAPLFGVRDAAKKPRVAEDVLPENSPEASGADTEGFYAKK